jgi:hypothetical protein
MIRSILLDKYVIVDSLEIYFIFFRALLYFLRIFEFYTIF